MGNDVFQTSETKKRNKNMFSNIEVEKNIVFGIPDPHPMNELKEELNEITKGKFDKLTKSVSYTHLTLPTKA